MRTAWFGLGCLLLSGCWSGERTPLPDGPTEWEPIAGDAPADWVISEIETELACPDGDFARLWLARPEVATEPLPIAVVFHGGAFDYRAPGTPEAPGDAYQNPTRLDRDWADRRAYAVLGMWAESDEAIRHTGALPLALAEQGRAVLIVPNCWGDYGYNQGDNDTNLDGFERLGGSATRLAWRLASEADFAAEVEIELGITPDPAGAVAVGLGQGGRSVGFVMKAGGLTRPSYVILDSVDDDLDVYFDEPGIWADQVAGLQRIWPGGKGAASATRLGDAALPEDTHFVMSAADPRLPAGVVDELVARVTARGGTVTDTTETRHIQLAGDLDLARTVVAEVLGVVADPDTDTDTDG